MILLRVALFPVFVCEVMTFYLFSDSFLLLLLLIIIIIIVVATSAVVMIKNLRCFLCRLDLIYLDFNFIVLKYSINIFVLFMGFLFVCFFI